MLFYVLLLQIDTHYICIMLSSGIYRLFVLKNKQPNDTNIISMPVLSTRSKTLASKTMGIKKLNSVRFNPNSNNPSIQTWRNLFSDTMYCLSHDKEQAMIKPVQIHHNTVWTFFINFWFFAEQNTKLQSHNNQDSAIRKRICNSVNWHNMGQRLKQICRPDRTTRHTEFNTLQYFVIWHIISN